MNQEVDPRLSSFWKTQKDNILNDKFMKLKVAGSYLYRRLKRVSGGSDEEAIKLWEEAVHALNNPTEKQG